MVACRVVATPHHNNDNSFSLFSCLIFLTQSPVFESLEQLASIRGLILGPILNSYTNDAHPKYRFSVVWIDEGIHKTKMVLQLISSAIKKKKLFIQKRNKTKTKRRLAPYYDKCHQSILRMISLETNLQFSAFFLDLAAILLFCLYRFMFTKCITNFLSE